MDDFYGTNFAPATNAMGRARLRRSERIHDCGIRSKQGAQGCEECAPIGRSAAYASVSCSLGHAGKSILGRAAPERCFR